MTARRIVGVVDVRMRKLMSPSPTPNGCRCCRNRPDTDGHHHIFGHVEDIVALGLPPADGLQAPGGGQVNFSALKGRACKSPATGGPFGLAEARLQGEHGPVDYAARPVLRSVA